jgi:hypothetical protein
MWVRGVNMKDVSRCGPQRCSTPHSSFPQTWSEICKTRVAASDKTGCEKKFLARLVSDQFGSVASLSRVALMFHTVLLQSIRVMLSLPLQSNVMEPVLYSLSQGHCTSYLIVLSRLPLFERVFSQVDSLIEAFYHLDENVKGEFLGMQMNKVRVV